jgi:predicted phage terminase large subunit-like protein
MAATATERRVERPGRTMPWKTARLPPAALARAIVAKTQAESQQSLLAFLGHLWRRPREPLQIGPHTRAIADRLTRAVADYRAGRSTYLEIVVPFRHGKSILSSVYLPAWFLGQFPDVEVMMAGYAADLIQGFSRDVRGVMQDERYPGVFPGVQLDSSTNNASERRIAGRTGRLYALGRGGGASGKGAGLMVVDDLFKNREEAESLTIRDSAWSSLTNDFLTRLAPVHVVLLANTRWHTDDHIGRIHARTTPGGEQYDPAFPAFERLHFSARQPGGTYLHEERFGRAWYEAQYASLGTYAASALLDGDPVVRGGAFLRTDAIQWADSFPAGLAWIRCWDLASSEVEVAKDDPDWTAGALVAVSVDAAGVETIHIDDVQMIRAEATRRDKLIRDTAKRDALRGIPQYIEAVAGYKDSYTTIRDVLKGVAVVHRVELGGDKVVRAGRVEPHFESGHVVMRRSQPWQPEVLRQLGEFPGGRHDDVVDSITSGYRAALARNKQVAGLGSALGRGAR